jgi:Na+/H+ antiporter NhaD/arsenite permease-like protein
MEYSLVHPNIISLMPFGGLLAVIALGPLCFADWWNEHYPKVCFGLGTVVVAYYVFGLGATGNVLLKAKDYVSFIADVGSLFVVSGGIHIRVKGEATPMANTVYLALGAILANLLGTTGASMLLIRPWIRMNKYRITGHHITFFIFIISNVGGFMTPVGPPLFLGYLIGVPFWWVAAHGWPVWLTGVGILLAMFYAVDSRNYRRAPKAVREEETAHEEWRFEGLGNLFFLAVIFAAVFVERPLFLREFLMVAAAAGSYFTTKKPVHDANHFNFHPVKEVAILFAGIFATMIPALDWLAANASKFGSAAPAAFYFGSGTLSSVLDNAPTYLSFVSALSGFAGTRDMQMLLAHYARFMLAISVGSVFFGANTYIGNGPNFMVKAIADQQQVHTPDFVSYILRHTIPFMLPMLLIVWLIFFRS